MSAFKDLLLRPVTLSDLDEVESMAMSSAPGLTNLPKDRLLLHKKINHSVESMQKEVNRPQDEYYLFALENIETNEVLGVCGILASKGYDEPSYSFRVEEVTHKSLSLNKNYSLKTLNLIETRKGPTEIGSLFLKSDLRQKGLGRFISQSRFLFMADHLQRFQSRIIAEMRGVGEGKENAVFWDFVGSHFFKMPFQEADLLAAKSKAFIKELMAKYPLYIDLLPKEAQDIIGRAHVNTLPALKILQSEGFELSNQVDVFDAGPKVTANISQVRSILHSHKSRITHFAEDIESEDYYLISKGQLNDFRVCCSPIKKLGMDTIVVPKWVQKTLSVNERDLVRVVSLYPNSDKVDTAKLDTLAIQENERLSASFVGGYRKGSTQFARRFSEWYKMASTSSKTSK